MARARGRKTNVNDGVANGASLDSFKVQRDVAFEQAQGVGDQTVLRRREISGAPPSEEGT